MWPISTLIISLCCLRLSCAAADKLSQYRSTITFYAFSESHPNGTVSTRDDTLESLGCDAAGNTSFVVHGWLESIARPWAKALVNEFLSLRGNCVFFMDYSNYSTRGYFSLTPHFNAISSLLTEKIKSIATPSRTVMFGFSFGARLVIDTGVTLYKVGQRIDRIFACDPAGPGFGGYRENAMIAADQVQCIHTSNNYGTTRYDCDQDWRLGNCGNSQPGHRPFPYGSHGLCPYFFIASFAVDFVPDNYYNCTTKRAAANVPKDLIMGPRETRRRNFGDIFAPTAKNPPWNVVDGLVNNPEAQFPQSKLGVSIFTSLEEGSGDLEELYNEIQFNELPLYD